ncbi:NnrS family protein [Herbaspirillum sp. RV1423]|uniref:NnrS family protein n=1 Tax=Herbaspirillum sp. RV1423 TaxID=1443993 RepID=UPI001E616779|nr:NnrS family protein [Herbaspirillum sp. RV1423]
MTIDEPQVIDASHIWQSDHPLWRLAFRPFYLAAAVFAVLAIPLWLASYFGWIAGGSHITLLWHMHEMVFGMVAAVIVGFLYTAGKNWTNLWTPRKAPLAALVGLWLAGRVAMLVAPPWLAAVVDLAFLPLAAWSFYRVLRKADNKRNLFLVGLLLLLGIANATFHGAALGLIRVSPILSIQAAILIVVLIESVIGARVIPMFTRNGAPGTTPVVNGKRDRITIILAVLAGLAWVTGIAPVFTASMAFAAGCATLARLAGWQPHRTLRVPLLWILHLSYGWIAIGFFLMALASLGIVPASAAFHALTVGSMAGLIMGMITRTALGHTGRPLKTGIAEPAMYTLIQLGALVRLLAALGVDGDGHVTLSLAAGCWSGAFLIYVIAYGPYLLRPRIDGLDG